MPKIAKNLNVLYPERHAEVRSRLQEIIDDFHGRNPELAKKKFKGFSEKDIVLICNGDHVAEMGKKTFRTMQKFLDKYAKGLVNKVHFLPFYPYSGDRGFSVMDYRKVNEKLGDWKDVKQISKSFDIMFDLVLNHASVEGEWFKKFLAGDEKYKDYFINFDREVDTSAVFRPRKDPLLKKFSTKKGEKYVWCTFPLGQADLNYANPDVFLEMIKVLLYYIENGASVIRLDAIAFLWKDLGTSCLHRPQAHAIVQAMREIVNMVAPYVWLITETNVPHKDNISYWGDGKNEAHLVYNFVLPPLLLYTFIKGDSGKLQKWLSGLKYPSTDATFFNFTASHDGIGVTPLKGIVPDDEIEELCKHTLGHGGIVSYRDVPGKAPVPYELNIVYMNAVGVGKRFLASQAIKLSLRGVPAIYFNSLIGEENWREGIQTLGSNRAINERKFGYDALTKELETEGTKKNYIYKAMARLLRVRRGEKLFSPKAEMEVAYFGNSSAAILRKDGKGKLLSVTNITGEKIFIDAEKLKKIFTKDSVRDILTDKKFPLSDNVAVRPYEYLWLK